MTINRDLYLNQLIAAEHDGFIKIITGIRRCGKSYLLFKLFKQHLLAAGASPEHIIEVDLEKKSSQNLRAPDPLLAHIQKRLVHDGKTNYVLIDEIQYCKRTLNADIDLSRIHPDDLDECYTTFYDVLNELRTTPCVDCYVTGSNSKMLSSDVATTFRGRGEEIRVFPLSMAEFLPLRESITDLKSVLREYLMYGGLPDCVLKIDERAKRDYLENLCKTIYLRDVGERNKIRNEPLLNALFDIVMSNVGCLTNPTKLANAVTTVAKLPANAVTVSKYLDYLRDAFLIGRAARYDVKGKHYLDYPVKYYAEDPGLRNVQMNFRQYEPTHLMENVIYNELVRRGYSVDVGVVETRAINKDGVREQRQHEIDFVVNRDSERIYIQSAWEIPDEAKREQELFSLTRVHDAFRKIVVTGDPYEKPWMSKEGVTFIGIVPFLVNQKSIETLDR